MRLFLKDLKVPLRAEFRLPEEAGVSAENREPEAEEAAADAVPAASEAAPASDGAEAIAADGAPDPRLPKMRAAAAHIGKRAAALPQGEARKTLGVELRQVVAQIDAGEAEGIVQENPGPD